VPVLWKTIGEQIEGVLAVIFQTGVEIHRPYKRIHLATACQQYENERNRMRAKLDEILTHKYGGPGQERNKYDVARS
jgi:hypothetical protein